VYKRRTHEQVIRLRTFSTGYGLAGLRIGDAVGNANVISGMNRIRNHFSVNRLAQAVALASLGDSGFMQGVVEQVAQGRRQIAALATSHGLDYVESAANFVAVDMGSAARATALRAELQKLGIFVRMPGVAPLNRTIRIGVGTAAEFAYLNEVFATALAAADA